MSEKRPQKRKNWKLFANPWIKEKLKRSLLDVFFCAMSVSYLPMSYSSPQRAWEVIQLTTDSLSRIASSLIPLVKSSRKLLVRVCEVPLPTKN